MSGEKTQLKEAIMKRYYVKERGLARSKKVSMGIEVYKESRMR